MNKSIKYFVVSDVHSFYSILKNTLNKKGFNKERGDVLVVNGDLFDRGEESVELFEFVKSLGDNFIYVRGNHEDLLSDCLYELGLGKVPGRHHFSNGTIRTISHFTGIEEHRFAWGLNAQELVALQNKMEPVISFIKEKCVNYFEIGPYIITHCWIPCESKSYSYFGNNKFDNVWPKWNIPKEELENSDKFLSSQLWEQARWGNPFEYWRQKMVPDGRVIVSGHWHCSWGHSHIDQKRKEWPDKNRWDWLESFDIWYRHNFIAIDGCVAYTKKLNCMVVEYDGKDLHNKTLHMKHYNGVVKPVPVLPNGIVRFSYDGKDCKHSVSRVDFYELGYSVHTIGGNCLTYDKDFEVIKYV